MGICRFLDHLGSFGYGGARATADARDASSIRIAAAGGGESSGGVRTSDASRTPAASRAERAEARGGGGSAGACRRDCGVVKSVALYARVSSEQQEKQATIGSQVAALVERAKADGHVLVASDMFVDDGYSGSTLLRPALEKLRDRAAEGRLDLIYVHSPDRLARRYAYQVLLLDELSNAGVSVIFLNGPTNRSAEDELLVQVQGMIAEYERAKILERSRRGKLHKARAGIVNPLSNAPYGYQYVRKTDAEPARYQVLLHEAKVVRQVFRWYVDEQISILAIAKRLTVARVPTRTGKELWRTSTVRNILRNPASAGRAAFGKTEPVEKGVLLRPQRGRSGVARAVKSSHRAKPSTEWISIPVAAIVSESLFAAAQEQLKRNLQLAARNCRGKRYLLQGLVVCKVCGWGFYGRSSGLPPLYYYRCGGSDAHGFGGVQVCRNPGVRVDQLDAYVWESVRDVLQHPDRVIEEWARRGREDGALADATARCDDAQRFVLAQQNALRRLQDAYEAGALTVQELAERTERMRVRIQRAEDDLTEARTSLTQTVEVKVLASKLADFASAVSSGLHSLDWYGRRQLLRTMVSRVEIDERGATVVYRIPTPRPPGEPSPEGPPKPAANDACKGGDRRLSIAVTARARPGSGLC